MKKLLVVFLVLAFVAPAMAADQLSIKGEYYVSGWSQDNVSDLGIIDDDSDKRNFWTQRMRLYSRFKAADGVTAHLRLDFGEYHWGNPVFAVRPEAGTNDQLQVDRVFVDVNKGLVRVRAGQQFMPLGQTIVFRDQNPGIQVDIKTPISIRLGYVKHDEGGALNDEDGFEDTDRYFIDLGYTSDMIWLRGFYAMQADGKTASASHFKDEPTVFGVYAKGKVGPIDLKGELAMFGGDISDGTTTIDYKGTQFNAEGIFKLSDALSLAAEVVYSDGSDAADEAKITYIGNPFGRASLITGGQMFGNYFDGNWKGGSVTGGTPIGQRDIFDPFETGAGSLGGGIGAQWTIMEDLSATGYFHYLTGVEDFDGAFDKAMVYQAFLRWMFAPKTMLQLGYLVVDADFDDFLGVSVDTDNLTSLWLNMTVRF